MKALKIRWYDQLDVGVWIKMCCIIPPSEILLNNKKEWSTDNATTWMNFRNMLSKRSHMLKTTYILIPPIWNSRKVKSVDSKIRPEVNWGCGWIEDLMKTGLRESGGGTGNVLKLDCCDG